MGNDNWYDEGIGSCSLHEKTMKSYNAYTPPSIDSLLKKKKKKKKKRGPCVACGVWTTHKEPLSHEKWDDKFRDSFACSGCLILM